MFNRLFPLLDVVTTETGAEEEIEAIITAVDIISAKKMSHSVDNYCKLVDDLE